MCRLVRTVAQFRRLASHGLGTLYGYDRKNAAYFTREHSSVTYRHWVYTRSQTQRMRREDAPEYNIWTDLKGSSHGYFESATPEFVWSE